MNIVDFYKKLSKILEMCREKSISHSEALFQLSQLLQEAEESKLEIDVSEKILDYDSLSKYDDEMSYDDTSYDSSYEEPDTKIDEDSSYSY